MTSLFLTILIYRFHTYVSYQALETLVVLELHKLRSLLYSISSTPECVHRFVGSEYTFLHFGA